MRALFLFGATLVALSSAASGQACDEFTYTDALTNQGWVAHSGAGNKIIMSNGGEATLDHGAGSGEDINLSFPAAGAGDTTYASMRLTVPSGNSVLPDADGLYFFHLKDAGFGFRARTGVVVQSGGGDYGLAIHADSSGLGGGATWTSDLLFDTEYFVVVNWDAATGTSKLWVDPTLESDPSISHTGTNTATLIEAVALRQSGDYTGLINVSQVKAGSTFNDVLGACPIVAVPALPTNIFLALIGLVGLAGISMIRRRS